MRRIIAPNAFHRIAPNCVFTLKTSTISGHKSENNLPCLLAADPWFRYFAPLMETS